MDDLFGKRKVTVWKRYDRKKQKWIHNHIEFGHVNGVQWGRHPKPKSKEQEKWKGQVWSRQHKHMDNNNVIF